ncbi:unnamed protein product, partial [Penicillium manginii]
MKLMTLDRLNSLEIINPKPLPPWEPNAFAEISITPAREAAEQEARNLQNEPG